MMALIMAPPPTGASVDHGTTANNVTCADQSSADATPIKHGAIDGIRTLGRFKPTLTGLRRRQASESVASQKDRRAADGMREVRDIDWSCRRRHRQGERGLWRRKADRRAADWTPRNERQLPALTGRRRRRRKGQRGVWRRKVDRRAADAMRPGVPSTFSAAFDGSSLSLS
eukprot:CAMPEP_0172327910 /NCGR_PEP_ID=MMETSP1058-20130122/60075_1 /TAXON_ID=83371 /ORGANISM="Detonula confervacea, Strain CCMP 353" /LENGTH=170 /DNA_ID=CAMNT_0013044997 /DNA_START=21 /DNA_END=535 /DNA_ORIENTATION=-